MQKIIEWLSKAVEKNASDIFIGVHRHILFKLNGVLTPQNTIILSIDEADAAVRKLYELAGRPMEKFNQCGDDDFSVSVPGLARFRVNVCKQRSTAAAVIRIVHSDIPDYRAMKIPDEVMGIAAKKNGLVLVTGAVGSGKSTTLGCVINEINKTRNCHIITMEDPIEFLHKDDKSIITQREVNEDTESYAVALRACLRQAPDIIFLGEMRDHETIRTAVTAAETGQLVISTLHTTSAVNTIDRIIDVFPPNQQQQIRVQLSMTLQTVVTQKLIQNTEGKLIPAFEILQVNNAVRTLIRESKTHQIDNVIHTSAQAQEKMYSMDMYIYKLYQDGFITKETALLNAVEQEPMVRKINGVSFK